MGTPVESTETPALSTSSQHTVRDNPASMNENTKSVNVIAGPNDSKDSGEEVIIIYDIS